VNHGSSTHDAWLEGDIKRGVQQTVVLQNDPTLAQRHDFGMSRGIVSANRAIPALANHLVVMNQHRPDRNLTFIPCATSED
jgi:hypothetical protein